MRARFVLRRLLLAVPTLVGISLVTFALVHLAPGDPMSGEEGSTSPRAGGSSRELQRLYFLDLPLFYNSNPRGLEARGRELVERLLGARTREERVRGSRALLECGTACLPSVARALDSSRKNEERRDRILHLVSLLRSRHPSLVVGVGESGPVFPPEAALEAWLGRALPRLDRSRLERLVGRLGDDPSSGTRLVEVGTAALGPVMEAALRGGESGRAARAVAARLVRLELPTDDSSAREILDEFWYVRRRDFVEFDPVEKSLGRLTETRYAKWIGRLLTLRFGRSLHDGQPVEKKIGEALPVTLLLSFLSLFLAYAIGIPLGVHAAVRRGTILERATSVLLFLLYSLPPFWVAMMLVLLLGGGIGLVPLFPISGLSSPGLEEASGLEFLLDRLHHLVLPVVCLTYGSLAIVSRYQRSSLLEVLREEYIRTARAKGLPERVVVFKHALRNSLLPTITLVGLQIPYLIGGSVIVERIFGIPGMGLLAFQSFLNRDYPVVMGISVLSAALTLLGLLLSDLLYAAADPRITVEVAK